MMYQKAFNHEIRIGKTPRINLFFERAIRLCHPKESSPELSILTHTPAISEFLNTKLYILIWRRLPLEVPHSISSKWFDRCSIIPHAKSRAEMRRGKVIVCFRDKGSDDFLLLVFRFFGLLQFFRFFLEIF